MKISIAQDNVSSISTALFIPLMLLVFIPNCTYSLVFVIKSMFIAKKNLQIEACCFHFPLYHRQYKPNSHATEKKGWSPRKKKG